MADAPYMESKQVGEAFPLQGLAAYAAARRTKEWGYAKCGEPQQLVFLLLSQGFIKLIVLAIVIAIPIANSLFSDWFSLYPYRIDLNWLLFALPSMMICSKWTIIQDRQCQPGTVTQK
jgi:hypothetical protein